MHASGGTSIKVLRLSREGRAAAIFLAHGVGRKPAFEEKYRVFRGVRFSLEKWMLENYY